MKKVVVATALSLTSLVAAAQTSAILNFQNGTLDKAKTEIDKAVTDAKLSAKAKTWYTKGQIYEAIAIDQTGVYAKLDSSAALAAYEAYKKALEVEPNGGKMNKEITEALAGQKLYQALMGQGAAKYQNKNFKDAIKMMSLAGEVMPKDTLSPLYTGISAQQAQDATLAKSQFEKYMTNGGKDASVIYSLATLYRNDKEIDKALATIDKGLQVLPTNKDLAAEKVNIMLSSGRMEEAIAGMKQLIEKDPTNATNALNLGIVYTQGADKLGDELKKLNDDAKRGGDLKKKVTAEKDALDAINGEIARLSAAIKKNPKAADLKRQLADVQKRQGEAAANVKQAEEALKAEEAKGINPAANDQKIAETRKKMEDQRNMAKEYYAKALSIDPNNYDANFNMGVAFFNEAAELNRQLSNMDVKEYQAKGKEVEGRVCGKFKKALPYFEKAKAVKDDTEVQEVLTSLQNNLKQMEEKKVVCVE